MNFLNGRTPSPAALKSSDASAAPRSRSWRRSRACQNSNGCLELSAFAPGTTGARDSVLGEASPVLAFDGKEMRKFFSRIRAGELDLL
ncbi:DUF397 domain-containing protein [Spirillospora sp. NPDC047279]|uniref:DUF397 domain-containing protein n=1 Tax=Spirillospora sp. NPDC047279 TaxID=3155478 RepID=UPI003408955C